MGDNGDAAERRSAYAKASVFAEATAAARCAMADKSADKSADKYDPPSRLRASSFAEPTPRHIFMPHLRTHIAICVRERTKCPSSHGAFTRASPEVPPSDTYCNICRTVCGWGTTKRKAWYNTPMNSKDEIQERMADDVCITVSLWRRFRRRKENNADANFKCT